MRLLYTTNPYNKERKSIILQFLWDDNSSVYTRRNFYSFSDNIFLQLLLWDKATMSVRIYLYNFNQQIFFNSFFYETYLFFLTMKNFSSFNCLAVDISLQEDCLYLGTMMVLYGLWADVIALVQGDSRSLPYSLRSYRTFIADD